MRLANFSVYFAAMGSHPKAGWFSHLTALRICELLAPFKRYHHTFLFPCSTSNSYTLPASQFLVLQNRSHLLATLTMIPVGRNPYEHHPQLVGDMDDEESFPQHSLRKRTRTAHSVANVIFLLLLFAASVAGISVTGLVFSNEEWKRIPGQSFSQVFTVCAVSSPCSLVYTGRACRSTC